jgi:hypothetical protein
MAKAAFNKLKAHFTSILEENFMEKLATFEV